MQLDRLFVFLLRVDYTTESRVPQYIFLSTLRHYGAR